MAVRMRKVLQTAGLVFECVTCFFSCLIIYRQRGALHRVGYNHLISNARKWNNCFIEIQQEMSLDLADFALQEQTEDNLIVAQFLWHGVMNKRIKSLKLRYTMIQVFF